MTNKPNLLFIMPDQLRHDFLSCYGASFIDTPNIDALCESGVRFENCYSEHPVCVPARAALLMGMNAIKTGVMDNGQYLRPDYGSCGLQTWPEILNDQGYVTLATGKMHFYPWEKRFGFQDRIIAEDKLWGYIEDDYHHFLDKAGYSKRSFADVPEYHKYHQACVSPLPWEYNVDHFVGVKTSEWIDAYDGDAPFAMMVGFPGPHSPYDPAEDYATFDESAMPEPILQNVEDRAVMRAPRRSRSDSSRKSWYAVKNDNPPTDTTYARQRAYYAGLVKQIDLEVGRIVSALDAKGLLDNTIIIFSSDHGDYLGDHGLSGKGTFYEGSCHVPMLVRHPEMAPTVSSNLVTLTDVTATLIGLSGASIPSYVDARPLPGIGIGDESRDVVFGMLRSGWMACDGEWKFVKYPQGYHLFNLKDDPTEEQNRAGDPACADVFRRLDVALTTEVMRLMDEGSFSGRVYTFSHSSSSEFGRPGWERRYPMPWGDIYPA